jgi:hypothetical protein
VGEIDHAGQAGEIGPTGDYWISRLAARNSSPGRLATVRATSEAIRQPTESAKETFGVSPYPEPTPAAIDAQRWTAGRATATHQRITLHLTDVATVAVDTVRAGLRCGTISVTSDGPARLILLRLRSGSRTVELHRGRTVVHACSART